MVNTGSKHRNIAPMTSIFPSLGSTGSIDKNFPVWKEQKHKDREKLNNQAKILMNVNQMHK